MGGGQRQTNSAGGIESTNPSTADQDMIVVTEWSRSMTFIPVIVVANSTAAPSAAALGPAAPERTEGCSISSTPPKPTSVAAMRGAPTASRSTNTASGTSQSVRVNESAFASASRSFWYA